jgi:hypothetical protein
MKFKLPTTFVSILLTGLALAACGDDASSHPDAAVVPPADAAVVDAAPIPDAVPTPDAVPPPDARPADLSCVGMEPPVGVVPDPLTIAGHTISISAGAPASVAGAAVEVRKVSDDSVLASATSAADGTYTVSVATAGASVTGYIHAAADSFAPSNLFPPDPIQASIGSLTVPLFATSLLPLLATLAGTAIVPGDGIAILQINDCAGESMAGVQVQLVGTNADTKIVYGAGSQGLPNPQATATDESGTVFVINIPPGPITIKGTYGAGANMHSVEARCFADQATLTELHP